MRWKYFSLLPLYLSKSLSDGYGQVGQTHQKCLTSIPPCGIWDYLEQPVPLTSSDRLLAAELLAASKADEPGMSLLDIISQIEASKIQIVMSRGDENGNTVLHNIVAGLIEFILNNDPKESRQRITMTLYMLNVAASIMDNLDQVNLRGVTVHEMIKKLSKISAATDLSSVARLSPLDIWREQVLMAMQDILGVNLRMHKAFKDVMTVDLLALSRITSPLLLLENHDDDAVHQFFSRDLQKYIGSHGITVIGLEFDSQTPLEILKDRLASSKLEIDVATRNLITKFSAESLGLSLVPLDIVPTHSDSELIIHELAARNFGLLDIINQARDRGIAYNAILASHANGGRVLISCGLAHGVGVIETIQSLIGIIPECLIISPTSSIPARILDILLQQYNAEILDYSTVNDKQEKSDFSPPRYRRT